MLRLLAGEAARRFVICYVAAAKIGAVTAGIGTQRAPPFPPDPARPVVITYTSGRTGPPKLVVFGNRQLEAIRAHGAGARWGTGDARLVPHPLGRLGFATRLPVFLQTGRPATSCPNGARTPPCGWSASTGSGCCRAARTSCRASWPSARTCRT
ncbi:hypothetical protein [Nonomuraea insulae]|uniref:AMP-binding enzyme n=1 Tax=Nonomuraea insulae TaxID=1616787 RepID=A0ABW1CKB6_9ACTN